MDEATILCKSDVVQADGELAEALHEAPRVACTGWFFFSWLGMPVPAFGCEFDTLSIDRERVVGMQGDGRFEYRLDELEHISVKFAEDFRNTRKKACEAQGGDSQQ